MFDIHIVWFVHYMCGIAYINFEWVECCIYLEMVVPDINHFVMFVIDMQLVMVVIDMQLVMDVIDMQFVMVVIDMQFVMVGHDMKFVRVVLYMLIVMVVLDVHCMLVYN